MSENPPVHSQESIGLSTDIRGVLTVPRMRDLSTFIKRGIPSQDAMTDRALIALERCKGLPAEMICKDNSRFVLFRGLPDGTLIADNMLRGYRGDEIAQMRDVAEIKYLQLSQLDSADLATFYLATQFRDETNETLSRELILDSAKKIYMAIATATISTAGNKKITGSIIGPTDDIDSNFLEIRKQLSIDLLKGNPDQCEKAMHEAVSYLYQHSTKEPRLLSLAYLLGQEIQKSDFSAKVVSYLIDEFADMFHNDRSVVQQTCDGDVKPALVIGVKSGVLESDINKTAAVLLSFIPYDKRGEVVAKLGISRSVIMSAENQTIENIISHAMPGLILGNLDYYVGHFFALSSGTLDGYARQKELQQLFVLIRDETTPKMKAQIKQWVTARGVDYITQGHLRSNQKPIEKATIEQLRNKFTRLPTEKVRGYSRLREVERIQHLLTPITIDDYSLSEGKETIFLKEIKDEVVQAIVEIAHILDGASYYEFLRPHDGSNFPGQKNGLADNVKIGKLLSWLYKEEAKKVQGEEMKYPLTYYKFKGSDGKQIIATSLSVIGEPFGVAWTEDKGLLTSDQLMDVLGVVRAVRNALREGD